MTYEDRVKAMRPETRQANIRNFEQLKESPRWQALSEFVRSELEKNTQFLKDAEEAANDVIQVE